MKQRSLYLRLSAAAVVSIAVALTLAGLFLSVLFERHVMRRVDRELSVYVKQLAAALEVGAQGTATLVDEPGDPRFEQPLSGLYWQIDGPQGVVMRSRSLWDQTLVMPPFNVKLSAPSRHEISGPDDDAVIAHARIVFLDTAQGDQAFRLVAALTKSEVVNSRAAFTRDLVIALGLLAVALVIAAWLQIHYGLRPLSVIRQHINDVRTGSTERLEGRYPGEVQMLVGEVNALLSANDKAVQRARDSAADLAHGLKTPLAVLQAEARGLAQQKMMAPAEEIAAQVEQMRVRVERHLAVVRMRGADGGAPGQTPAFNGFERIVKAMRTMPRGEAIDWRLDVPDDLKIGLDTQDFYEVFGNLLDNARKWAEASVRVEAGRNDGAVFVRIKDDGPGVPEQDLPEIVERGRGLDEQKTGAGLGLSIAKKVLEAYAADIAFENGETSGVCVTVTVPDARGED